MLSVFADERARAELQVDLDELLCDGARRMLAAALEAEVDAYIAAYQQEVDQRGHRLVRRNGHAAPRVLATGAGAVEVVRPAGGRPARGPGHGPTGAVPQHDPAALVPPLAEGRRGAAAAVSARAVQPGLHPALEGFFGFDAGLSASVITRLCGQWRAEQQAFARRDLSDRDDVYRWADGMHFNVRLQDGQLCCLVLVGVRTDGTRELVAVADGERESSEATPPEVTTHAAANGTLLTKRLHHKDDAATRPAPQKGNR